MENEFEPKIKLPKYLEHFYEEAKNFLNSPLKKGLIVDFVGNFYEVTIPDKTSDLIWRCFFKLSPSLDLIDSFCSCPEEELGCIHIAIAYLHIYQNSFFPLHITFVNSFWHVLFKNIYIKFEKTPPQCKDKTWSFQSNSSELFEVSITTSQELFHQISDIFNPNITALQASIKYSDFSAKEFLSWKENTFSRSNHKYFLLSPWYELGKFCFLRSFSLPYEIKFKQENSNKFPKILTITWEKFVLSCYLTENLIYKCLPFLETVTTDLQLWPQTKEILSIDSDPDKQVLHIHEEFTDISKEIIEKDSNSKFKNAKFIPEKGFLLERPFSYTLPLEEVSLWLMKKKYFLSSFIHNEVMTVFYEFNFDIHANLHCFPFLFEHKDIKTQGLIVNTNLIFINNKGFYKVSGLFNSESEIVIPSKKLEDYLDNYPNLFIFPGFQIFLTPPDTCSLTFSVNDNGALLFFYPNQNSTLNNQTFHFGKWTYHANIGFFLNQDQSNNPIKTDTIVNKEDVCCFINKNQELLKKIPNFFYDPIPFKDIVIEIKQISKTKITLETFIQRGSLLIPCKIFNEYVFIENESFAPLIFKEEISVPLYPREISGSEITLFYTQELKKLSNPIKFSSLNITPTETQILFLISLTYDSQNQLLVKLKLVTELGALCLNEILTAVKSNKEFLFSPAGYINTTDPAFKLIAYLKEKEAVTHQGFYLSVIDILKLDALFPISIDEQASEETLSNFKKIKEYCIPHPPELNTQHKHLRPYQKNGLLWLWFLYHNGISGLLCDEMGLGKTHQAMALINTCALSSSTSKLFLVVCPTSVLMHWVILLQNYFSNLPKFFFHTKAKKSTLPTHGVIITSYGMLRHQYKLFYEKHIEIAIFDEIQLAKNKNSQIHKILCRLDAKMKLGLTGTPIENNVQELKALFDIVLPNYLPPDPIFKNLFSPNSKKNQISEKNRVLKIIKPFILRRTKNAVLPELPAKIEKNLTCYLSEEQKQLYTQLLKQESHIVSELLSPDQATPSYIHIFALLNHLKQICDHPAVFLKNPKSYKKHTSGKWNIFTNLLDTNLANGNKVVIFSQYLSMIQIIKTYLTEQKIEFALIHGKSQNRQKEVDRFQNDPNCKVFLGSLLASGVGINLTAGNVVIMYDRWWNPAKENQALDRVHRIGQKNIVFIYRLITANTIEDKIHLLIEKKLHLFNEIIPNNETEVFKMFNKEDLLEILNYKATYEEDEADL